MIKESGDFVRRKSADAIFAMTGIAKALHSCEKQKLRFKRMRKFHEIYLGLLLQI